MRIADKVILITGAHSPIADACVRLFVSRKAKVIVTDPDEAHAQKVIEQAIRHGGEAIHKPCDPTKKLEISNCFRQIEDEFGRLDHLVYLLPRHISPKKAYQYKIETLCDYWDKTIAAFQRLAMAFQQTFMQHILSDEEGFDEPLPDRSLLAIAPNLNVTVTAEGIAEATVIGALAQLLRSWAVDGKAIGLRANMLYYHCSAFGADEKQYSLNNGLFEQFPSGRPPTAEEMARVAAFYLSEDARYITAASLTVDGGGGALQAFAPIVAKSAVDNAAFDNDKG